MVYFLPGDTYHMRKGFTLVEMLVTVSIILIISLIGLNGFQTNARRIRDDRRKIHLEEIRTALEMYRTSNLEAGYPNALSALVPQYIDGSLPTDPGERFVYYYQRTAPDTYQVCAYLEGGGTDDCGNNCLAPGNCNYRVTNP